MSKSKSSYSILDDINYPSDLKNLNVKDLKLLSDELREELIYFVSKTGGHLGAGLGVVELTVAIHYIFDTPHDMIVWDIGHQSYPHKILTGRRHLMHTLRQGDGISGFLKRDESIYDTFGAGHSSTSISAALGMCVGYEEKEDKKRNVIAIIGDSAMTAGMAYEALNHAGSLSNKLIIILNDNGMSIAPGVGALHNILLNTKTHNIHNTHTKSPSKVFFEELGLNYFGPIDGHNVEQLTNILEYINKHEEIRGPILLHVKTIKGYGFSSPEQSKENYHAVNKFDINTKIQQLASKKPTFTKVFAETLIKLAGEDDEIVAITAAMPSGTGLDMFAKHFPDRMYDVGIAEQHAVTFAAGLAVSGRKPFVAIYSTFLQRAYDQIIHDVAIQNLPIRFVIDRAGFVGADGPTHAGSFDIMYLINIPNLIIMVPSDENELALMLTLQHSIDYSPSAVRFPRGEIFGLSIPTINFSHNENTIQVGKGKVVKSISSNNGFKIAIISIGPRLYESLKAAQILEDMGVFGISVIDARFAKPLDEKLIFEVAQNHNAIITIEEGSSGGFGAAVSKLLSDEGMLDDGKLKFRQLCMPDSFVEHGVVYNMYEEAGLNASSIVKLALKLKSTNTDDESKQQ